MAGKLIYTTYASGPFTRNLKPNAFFARHFMGADKAMLYTRDDLERDPLYAAHKAVFDARRGAGYWAWKPLFIFRALQAAGPDDVVLYQDCGNGLRYKGLLRPRKLVEFARQHGFMAGVRSPQYGANRLWNRRRCRAIMGATDDRYGNAASIEASISVWPNTAESRDFVESWLKYCLDLEAIRDATSDELDNEDEGFREHRYDQAILTNLVLVRDAPALDVLDSTRPFAKSVTALELDLRSRSNVFWRIVHRAITGTGAVRRNIRTRIKA